MKKILSLDGGGMRGIVTLKVLQEIESDFDLIVGTSTGALIGTFLAYDYTPEEILDLYINHREDIFDRRKRSRLGLSLINYKYDNDKFKDLLFEHFSYDSVSDVEQKLMVNAFDMNQMEPKLFKSYKKDSTPLYVAVLASCSAPTYFKPVEYEENILIDGGVAINNPALSALVEAEKLWPDEELKLVSLGTTKAKSYFDYDEVTSWGLARWASPLVSILTDGQLNTTDYLTSKYCENDPQKEFIRVQHKTGVNISLDDTDAVDELMELSEEVIDENIEKIEQV